MYFAYFLYYRISISIITLYNTQETSKMFGALTYEQPLTTGKKIGGYQLTRKQAPFSLGWDPSEQMNSYQLRKNQGKQITGKITSNRSLPEQYPESRERRNEIPMYDEAEERMKMKQLYEQLAHENPDIPPEALEKYMLDYEDQRKAAFARQQQRPPLVPSRQQQFEKRRPVVQKQTMKGLIYNGVGVGESMQEKRAASRRNKSNLVLGDGYNYFQQNQRR